MNAHKYTAPTMREALALVREALGEEALIIRSEKVKSGGAMNFLGRELIEVTAALPDEVKADLQVGPEFANTLEREFKQPAEHETADRPSMDITLLNDEIRRLREDLTDIGKHLRYNNLPSMPRELARVWESLGQAGVSSQWATDLAQEALVQLGADELVSAQAVENYLINRLTRVVRPAPQSLVRRRTGYKIALVGSPGAGKTTLVQKLASDPIAYAKRKVGLLSLDTHRMAAIEQIKTFARIAGAPLEVVFQPDQCAQALARLASCEIILIDTPGCSLGETERLEQLRAFFEQLDPDEIHLVQNAAVRDEDLIHQGRRFRDVGLSHLSFTRIDESLRHGYLLNVVKATEKPVAWISTGQGFIGKLERFTPAHLRRWIALSEPVHVPAMPVPATMVR